MQLQFSLMGACHCLDHGQAQAGAVGLGGKKGFAQTLQHGRFDTTATVADAQAQLLPAVVQVHLEPRARAAGLGGVFDQVEQ